ncbi:MAG: N-acyl-D-amino-acid deacylase [Halioglobus sp.]|jgi:N-acyl-D-amino-acid deacylase
MSYDLVIRNGTIADGSGGSLIDGDVAIGDGKIVQVGGNCNAKGAQEYDAAGKVVAPGFIDPHTHLDANLFWDPDLTPSSSFGVTTIVAANCGYGLAPIGGEAAHDYLIRAMSTVEQIPEEAIRQGVPFNWQDLRSYFEELDRLPVLLNHAHLIPHVPLRAAVMGVPDAHSREATEDELTAMCALLQEGLELGGLGFSTDQVIGNPGPEGSKLPGQICGEEELLHFADVLGQGPGPGLFTMANAALLQGRKEQAADLSWHERLARRSGKPVVVGPVMDPHDDPGAAIAFMDSILERRATGMTVVPQVSTRPFELWTRLDAPGAIVRALPSLVAAVKAGGADAVRKLAADPQARQQLRKEAENIPPSPIFSGRWEHIYVRYTMQDGNWSESVGAIAHQQGIAPTDLLLDTVLADNFETQIALQMRNADDAELGRIVSHPAAMIGASDAGAHVLSNTDSCYALWTLQHWVRERRELTLEQAIAKLTWSQAQLLGLTDRGLLHERMAADIVVFDPDTVGTTGVRFVDDQPAGGRRLITQATGVALSVVNGVIATRDGRSTGARSGQRLRHCADVVGQYE